MHRRIYSRILKKLLIIHNQLYKLISIISIKAENGIHPKHRITKYHNFFINNINENSFVLDIGCGNGALSFDLSKKAKKVVAIDLNTNNIEYAKRMFSASNIDYIIGDATKLDIDKKFDVIILSNVLEHLKERFNFLKLINKIAPKKLIRVPMINRDWITLLKKEMGLNYKLDNTHYIEYTLESFKDEMAQAGYIIEKYLIQFGEIWAILK